MKNADIVVYLLSGLWFFLGWLLMRRARQLRERANTRVEGWKVVTDKAITIARNAEKCFNDAKKSIQANYLDSPPYQQYLVDNKLRESVGLPPTTPEDALRGINEFRRNRGLSAYASLEELPACYSELLK